MGVVDESERGRIDVNECLRRAVEIKAKQLSDARREYEEAPEFVKQTISRDRDAAYDAVRGSSIHERALFASDLIERANSLTRGNEHEEALELYSDALAVFCHFARPSGTESTSRLVYVDHLEGSTTDEGAEAVKRIMLNASACMMNENLSKRAREIEWATTQALRIDASCAAAYFRRAKARASMDGESAMEKAMSDFKRAAELEPREKKYARALEEHGKALSAERNRQRAVFQRMFSPDRAIYEVDDDEEALNEDEVSDDVDAEIKRMLLDAELKAKARAMGFDVESVAFREEFATRVREELDAKRHSRAQSLGLNLDDDQVKGAIEYFERKRRANERANGLAPRDSQGGQIARYFTKALLVVLVARIAYMIHVLLTARSSDEIS